MRKIIWLKLAAWAAMAPVAASAQVVVVSSSTQEHAAAPGEVYSGSIRVVNHGTESEEVRIYQTDYSFQSDGSTLYPTAGSMMRSNASWMRVSPSHVTLGPGQAADVAYEVSVPSGAGEVPGSYWSMVMVEPRGVGPADAAGTAQPQVGLTTVVRFGIQIATHVNGGSHELAIGRPHVMEEGDSRWLEFSMENAGERAYRPQVSLELYDALGARVAVLEAQRGLLYPGTSTLQRFAIPDLRGGDYEAMVIVDTGAEDIFGAQFRLALGSGR